MELERGTKSGSYSPGAPTHYKREERITVEAELNGAMAELVRGKGARGATYEHLKQAHALANDLGTDAFERLDKTVAVLESHREWYDTGKEEKSLRPPLLELFAPLTTLERGSIL